VATEKKVFIVGAGPGDPDLLTVKALRLLQEAEVVVYDRLVSAEILQLIPAGTKRIYVGKATGRHHMDQDAINCLLVNLARAGHQVVRLKGGDPFTFGRGGEEARYLVAHEIPFEVVPGITAASACSAYAGIPLTHRGVAKGVRLMAGHCQSDRTLELDWQSLADPETTLVFYMGLANAERIRGELIGAGLPATTPVAVVESGTTPRQRTCVATLAELPGLVDREAVQAPAMIIIGRVVNFADELAWFQEAGEMDALRDQQSLGA